MPLTFIAMEDSDDCLSYFCGKSMSNKGSPPELMTVRYDENRALKPNILSKASVPVMLITTLFT